MINIKLDNFEGPIDLLLHLVETKKMDIRDIQLNILIDEYIGIMNLLYENNFKIKVEFLQMATELIEIKALSILKKDKIGDKKTNLEQKILEYKIIKEFSKKFSENENEYYISYSKNKGLDNKLEDIEHDYTSLSIENLTRCLENLFKKHNIVQKEIIKIDIEEEYSIEDATNEIMNIAYNDRLDFSSLLKGKFNRSRIVSYFLAVLELYKNNTINILIEDDTFYILKEKNV